MTRARAPLALVVAIADGGVIGRDSGLPWHIPEDLRHFKEVTMGHAIVMGRKTFQSIGRALPGRTNIVVTRAPSFSAPDVRVAGDLDSAIAMAREVDGEPRIIGGASIYAATLPLATKIFLTEIHRQVDGDTSFPPFDRDAFEATERRPGQSEGVVFVTLCRREDEPSAHAVSTR